MNFTLKNFIDFAQGAFSAYLHLGTFFGTRLGEAIADIEWLNTGLMKVISDLIRNSNSPILNMTVFEMLFSSEALMVIVTVGIVRWILDILP